MASRGITVNAVAPGFITTPMTEKLTDEQKSKILTQVPAGRMGEAAEDCRGGPLPGQPRGGLCDRRTLHVNGGMAMF